jgi:hypothetical protein
MLTKQLQSRTKRRVEPKSKHDGLTQSETNQWLDFFGMKK